MQGSDSKTRPPPITKARCRVQRDPRTGALSATLFGVVLGFICGPTAIDVGSIRDRSRPIRTP